MMYLPEALKPLAAYKQFTVYKLIPRPDGKTDKLPCDFRTGKACSWTDPAFWTNSETAIRAALNFGENFGVGFVLTETDPFFLLDIDNCVVNGDWSDIAKWVAQCFPGVAIEISQSGTGWHLIGSGRPPVHGCRNDQLGLEFYHSGRHIALTGNASTGNASTDCTDVLAAFLPQYFPPIAKGSDSGWTDEPCEGWNGPKDDDVLIERALRSKSPSALFGKKASFADLWTCNIEILAECYPPENAYSAFGQSKADMALAQHLAFWTGNDCERIERLMERSGLLRDKFDRKDGQYGTYLRRTIQNAVDRQLEVLTDKVLELPADTITTQAAGEPAQVTPVTGNTFVNGENQAVLFAGCVYVQDVHKVLVPGGSLLKPDQFKVAFGGYTFTQDNANIKTTKDAWEAFTQNQSYRPAKAKSTCFQPNEPPGKLVDQGGQIYVNKFWPVTIKRTVGDIEPFLIHLKKLFPNERDRIIALSFMCAIVQYQGHKFDWAVLFQGLPGNGKTILSYCVQEAVGHRYTFFPRADQISEKFNSWLFDNIFIGVHDVSIPSQKREIFEILKPMITDKRQSNRAMQTEGVMVDVVANFIFNCNPSDGLLKTMDDRRICPLFCAQQNVGDKERDGMTGEYFPNLIKWLKADGYAIVSELLHTWPIPEEFNPANGCTEAPVTTSTKRAIEASSGSIEQEVMEALQQGLPGFRGGWVSSIMLDKLLETLGLARRITRFKRKEMLLSMGYIPHPGLPDGRVNNAIGPDNGKPRLFIKMDAPERHLTGAVLIAKAYEDANFEAFKV